MTLSAAALLPKYQFTVSHGSAEHWGAAAKICLDGLGLYRAKGANLGFLYATEPFADDLGSILTFLRETTQIKTWVGGIVPGLCAQSTEYRETGAIGIMVGSLPEGSFRTFTSADLPLTLEDANQTAILHGDPRHPTVFDICTEMGNTLLHTVGGLVSGYGPVYQAAGTLAPGAASGLLLGPDIKMIIGLSQGCSPIGPAHIITKSDRNVLIELDGLNALDVLKAESGDLIARDLRRAAGYIHVGLLEGEGYTVRTLIGIDPDSGMLAMGAEAHEGERVVFVRRDANTAQTDLTHMLERLKTDLKDTSPLGALYYSCTARGVHMFGAEGAELAQIRDTLDDIPLLGFFANGEIADGHLYGYTGVLAVLVPT